MKRCCRCCLCKRKAKSADKIVDWCQVQFFQPTPEFQANDFAEFRKKVKLLYRYKGLCKNCLCSLARPCDEAERDITASNLSNACAHCHVTVINRPRNIGGQVACSLCYQKHRFRHHKTITFHSMFCERPVHSCAECLNFSVERTCNHCERVAKMASSDNGSHKYYCNQHIPKTNSKQNDSETEEE